LANLEELAQQVGQALTQRGWTISAAESCTGGLLTSTLTDVAGSSAYVLGSVVSYSNEVKSALVGVKDQTLIEHGAVSEPTAREMAAGVRDLIHTDIGVSITGIAGPGGGTDEKPVGLTYIGLATPSGVQVKEHIWAGSRGENKQASVEAAFKMILQAVQTGA